MMTTNFFNNQINQRYTVTTEGKVTNTYEYYTTTL